jgi:hypothetical protein
MIAGRSVGAEPGATVETLLGKNVVATMYTHDLEPIDDTLPKGMVILYPEGKLYVGREDAFTGTTVTISAPAGTVAEPYRRASVTLERRKIRRVEMASIKGLLATPR